MIKTTKGVVIKTEAEMNEPIRTQTIYQGNSMILTKRLRDNSVDCIISDPPYVLEKRTQGSGCLQGSKYLEEIEYISDGYSEEMLYEFVRICKTINFFFFCSKRQLRFYFDFFNQFDCEYELIYWNKVNSAPTCNNKYLSDTELVLRVKEKNLGPEYDLITDHYITTKEMSMKAEFDHPTVKNPEIFRDFIKAATKENDVVYDPFAGTSPTAIACLKENRRFICCELFEKHCITSAKRIHREAMELGIEIEPTFLTDEEVNLCTPEEGVANLETDSFDLAIIDATAYETTPYELIDAVIDKMTLPNFYVWMYNKDVVPVIMYYESKGFLSDIISSYEEGGKTRVMLFFRANGRKLYTCYHTSRKFYSEGIPYQATSRNSKQLYLEESIGNYDDNIPYMLLRNVIINSSQEGETILDISMNKGLTAEICIRTNRKYIGFVQSEIDLYDCAERISATSELKYAGEFGDDIQIICA